METDSPEDNAGASEEDIGSSDIDKFSFESTLAGRGFDDLCMIDSFDIGNMKAGAARKRGGRRSAARRSERPSQTMPQPPGSMRPPGSFGGYANDRFMHDHSDEECEMDGIYQSRTSPRGNMKKQPINNKATSPGFMQLLNSGCIDGSFAGWFLDLD